MPIPPLIPQLMGLTLRSMYQPLEIYRRYQQINPFNTSRVRCLRHCSYGEHAQQKLDLYLPPSSNLANSSNTASPSNSTSSPHAVVIYAHGGNWVSGDKSQYHQICKQIAEENLIVANVNYRLAPTFSYKQQVQDINQAVQWVCKGLPQFNGDAQQLFLMGDTAGANLLCTYAVALNHPYLRNALVIQQPISSQQVKGIALLYGAYDLERGLFANLPFLQLWHEALLGTQTHNSQTVSLASPLRHLHRHLPPLFLGAAEADPLFSQSVLMAHRLKALNHRYTTAFYDKADYSSGHHFWFSWQNNPCTQKMLADALLFLKLQRYQLQLAATQGRTIQPQTHNTPEIAI